MEKIEINIPQIWNFIFASTEFHEGLNNISEEPTFCITLGNTKISGIKALQPLFTITVDSSGTHKLHGGILGIVNCQSKYILAKNEKEFIAYATYQVSKF